MACGKTELMRMAHGATLMESSVPAIVRVDLDPLWLVVRARPGSAVTRRSNVLVADLGQRALPIQT